MGRRFHIIVTVHPLFPYIWRRQVRQAHGHPLIFFMRLFLTTPVYVNLLSSGSPMHLIYFPLNISSCTVPTSMLYFHWQYRHFPSSTELLVDQHPKEAAWKGGTFGCAETKSWELISPDHQPSTVTNYLLPWIINFIPRRNTYLPVRVFLTSVETESFQPGVQMRNQAVLLIKSQHQLVLPKADSQCARQMMSCSVWEEVAFLSESWTWHVH